jgi:hypothetical protein
MPRVVTVDAATCVVTATGPIENDGVASSTVTIRVLNTDGNPMAGLAAANIVLAVTGTGNTLTQPTGVTDNDGYISGSFVSSGAATKTASFTVLGTAITDTASVVVSAASGTVATVTDISRDADNTAGGARVTFTITGPVDLPTVTFDGVSATGITLDSSTSLSCNVPAGSAGLADIVVGGVNFVNPRAAKIGGDFEYLPVASTTFVDADFEGGVIPASLSSTTSGGTLTVTTADKYSGTYSLLASVPAGTGGQDAYVRNATNIDIGAEANGVYVRYYAKMTAATAANLGDQIKSYLFRRAAGGGQPGWIMQGIGPDFPSGGGTTFVSFIDNGILNINGTPNQGRSGVATGEWVEWVNWQYWNGSAGRCKQWVNGKLLFDVTDAALGSANTDYRVRFGIPYSQNATGTCEVYVDEIFVGNGFPSPVEV